MLGRLNCLALYHLDLDCTDWWWCLCLHAARPVLGRERLSWLRQVRRLWHLGPCRSLPLLRMLLLEHHPYRYRSLLDHSSVRYEQLENLSLAHHHLYLRRCLVGYMACQRGLRLLRRWACTSSRIWIHHWDEVGWEYSLHRRVLILYAFLAELIRIQKTV